MALFFLPYKYKINIYPTWINPARYVYYGKFKNSDINTLKNSNLQISDIPTNRIQLYAYNKGWVRLNLGYYYNKQSGLISRPIKNTVKLLHIYLNESPIKDNILLHRTIIDVCKYHEMRLGKLCFQIHATTIYNKDVRGFKTIPIFRCYNSNLLRHYFISLKERQEIIQ